MFMHLQDDNGTAVDNLAALVAFFDRFPSFKPNQFFVSGESYAGVYVPTLSRQIFETATSNQINMQGFLVPRPLSVVTTSICCLGC